MKKNLARLPNTSDMGVTVESISPRSWYSKPQYQGYLSHHTSLYSKYTLVSASAAVGNNSTQVVDYILRARTCAMEARLDGKVGSSA